MKEITMNDFGKKFDITSKSKKALTRLILGIPLFHNSIADCLKKDIKNPSEIIKDQVKFFAHTEEQFDFFESWYMSLWGNNFTISQFPTSEDKENLNTEGFTFVNPYNHE